MAKAPRVVLDTNVVLSALIFKRAATSRFRLLWQQGTLVPLVCAETARELIRVLAYPKFKLDKSERDELLCDFLPYAHVVSLGEAPRPKVRLPRSRDPFDDMFLQMAQAGRARAVITGDKGLLALAPTSPKQTGFSILSPVQALEQWGH